MLSFLLFVSAAHAFTSPASLRTMPSSPASSRTAVTMIDADTLLVAVPSVAALGVSLQQSSFGGGVAQAPMHAAMPAPMPKATEKVDVALARKNFKRWNDALQTKNPTVVADLYSSEALSFLPTVSPMHIKDGMNTEEYFTAFVQKNPFGTITDDSVQPYGNGDAYLHSGLYTFELGTGAERAPVQARFSYVWKKEDGSWKISHHHSSVRPAGPDMLQVARDNFKKWNDALQTKDPKKVAALYSTSGDLSFLPTVSPEHIKDGSSTEDYFTAFVQKNPFGTITDDSVMVFDDGDAYLHSGLYTFDLGEGRKRAPTEARFSYVWRKSGGDYKITHHHSSVRPE
ncbi:hypothetical protein CTAYLR_000847 [Chrysophaeum taylorii]|uniref:Calcium/calmodulin-dependent protein kinase II association-domain domain-containing protein n=1 Tax=Chrysophaeum taylorii TaxID=2483200 RepID=A0AAD7UQF3_9STRA|nr:hypothetical protein CTAYLR_000847 [Chrysophaeum taylorii]